MFSVPSRVGTRIRMAMARHMSDRILVNDLSVHTTLGSSLWARPDAGKKRQPVSISISVPMSLRLAGNADHLDNSISYGTICKATEKCARQEDRFSCVEELAEEISRTCFTQFPSMAEISVRVAKPRGLLHAKAAGIEITRGRAEKNASPDKLFVETLTLSTIIGLNPWERLEKQPVHLNLSMETSRWRRDTRLEGFDFRLLANNVSDHVVQSSYQTVETLATEVARVALSSDNEIQNVTVWVAKPSALMFASSAEVEITRNRQDFADTQTPSSLLALSNVSGRHRAVLALGSNLGDRSGNIERALRALEDSGMADVVDTSFMYETAAMYVEDQPKFLNAACVVDTSLEPGPLLSLLKEIEASVGRTPTFTNGPRVVDLDMIFYNDLNLHLEESSKTAYWLTLPHPRVQEREFVLRPLADMLPDLIHPTLRRSIRSLLADVTPQPPRTSSMYKVISFPTRIRTERETADSKISSTVWTWPQRTYIMAIINTTPDSFSDGGVHFVDPHSPEREQQLVTLLQRVRQAIADGADVLDIGGYSTRPGAKEVTETEEIERVVPLIKLLRSSGVSIPISIDSFRAEVAKQAVLAGANCVNDVYSMSKDPNMLQVVKDLGLPVVMMHSRGDAGKDKDYPDGVMEGVRRELGEKVDIALRSGIRRWNIIADPGLGFSKDLTGNITLLRDLGQFTTAGEIRHPLDSLPVLVGASRKSFLGRITGADQPVTRKYETATACSAAIQQGCNIVRVHDVKEMADVAKVADAIWRLQ